MGQMRRTQGETLLQGGFLSGTAAGGPGASRRRGCDEGIIFNSHKVHAPSPPRSAPSGPTSASAQKGVNQDVDVDNPGLYVCDCAGHYTDTLLTSRPVCPSSALTHVPLMDWNPPLQHGDG